MSTVNLDTSASSVNELSSATTTTRTSAAASAQWRKYLLDELKKDSADTSQGTLPLNNGLGMPPPPSNADMQALLAQAVEKGVLTQAEADSLMSIMAKRQAGQQSHKAKGTEDDMQALFAILKEYMVAEDTDDTQTEETTTTGTTQTYTVEELQAKMKADKAARLAKLKAAVAAAQAAGALSTAQLTKITTFITEEETITAGMDKIAAAGLKG